MSVRNPHRDSEILDAAAELFAQRPFHEVRLDDIATKARIGKGTVYLYWSSKEEVFLAVIRRGFAAVAEQIERELPGCGESAWAQIDVVVRATIDFAFSYPGVYRIMRGGSVTPEDPELQRIRRGLTDRIDQVLIRGVERGELNDPCPAMTTQYLLSFVRGVMLYPPPDLTPEKLRSHMMHLLKHGLSAEGVP